ncbi:MAG: hypothetical protein UV82_C0009G0092 [Candidatus Magasanikbacteria bacterium GW2011_GWD2_43_18]|uniref:DUF1761 domain-containing protein n=1 Tax=Candidatus Magasanikbacteria bacterium GW2011_GWE2_42_7 TaxID=1619052 RepID=A0A0G1BC72_9BACT|nr:MAG: hypothetical protein UV42_C0041G0014 [Candidatus Magasanikbacteria bacterium GW2011_GWE2_42_7]KKT04352.1 MAG: hypothetical protein UV82_C0009G0092 [Candidatus Magasanikbacteria bacterium GW2011_GWD2_43_18]KKT25347.1 MAG: hypothetical protein UW10_C0009G0030 [Candidatus Magasanikbacteria bacterium GW2011_GWA2_43_9]HBB38058.1 hypothetical protein [Candidatus Magasanikbacteria bacterium]HCC13993.1 hypothetical protein [Candidatus Magasanikbacteria bacterium]
MDVNYLTVAVAALAGFFIGFLWYMPPFFGKAWMKAIGISPTPEQMKEKKGMMWRMGVSLVSVFLVSFVLAYLIEGLYVWKGNLTGSADAMYIAFTTSFLVWLGFLATSLLDSVLWEKRPWSLWLINAGQWLVRLVVMGVIIGAMM